MRSSYVVGISLREIIICGRHTTVWHHRFVCKISCSLISPLSLHNFQDWPLNWCQQSPLFFMAVSGLTIELAPTITIIVHDCFMIDHFTGTNSHHYFSWLFQDWPLYWRQQSPSIPGCHGLVCVVWFLWHSSDHDLCLHTHHGLWLVPSTKWLSIFVPKFLVSLTLCICINLWLCVCVSICVCCVNMCMSMYVVHMCVCVCVHADVSVSVYTCVRVCMHACMRVSVLCVCVWVWVCLTYSTNSHEISVLRMIGGTVDQALMRAESGTVPIGTMQRRCIGQEWKHASGDQLISVTGSKGCAAGLQVQRIVCGAGLQVQRIVCGAGLQVQRIVCGAGLQVQRIVCGAGLQVQRIVSGAGLQVQRIVCGAGLQVQRIVCGAGTGVKSQSQHLLNLGVRSSVTVWNLWLCEACDYVKPVVKDFASPGTPSATMLV